MEKNYKFHIVKNRKIFFIISLAVILAGVISFIIQGFNLDIDFIGGTSMQIENIGIEADRAQCEKISGIVKNVAGFEASSVQKIGDDGKGVLIKTKAIDSEVSDKIFKSIKTEYNITAEAPASIDNVSASVGSELTKQAIWAVSIAIVLMLVYIAFRFEVKVALSAVIALIHDVLIMLTFYSIFRIPVNMTFVAALLTILGYSINATIIIFDRIRENSKYKSKESLEDKVNRSVWQTMGRSLNTTITTLCTIGTLAIIGVSSIKIFAVPIIVGLLAGLFSSVFISGNIYYLFKREKGTAKKVKKA